MMDTVRWVLGEQKRRTPPRQNDLGHFQRHKKRKEGQWPSVFSPSKTRNILPTGCDQVTINRILYRYGDSGCRPQRRPLSPPGHHLALPDTGIGVGSYAVIALNVVGGHAQRPRTGPPPGR
ncbi:MAG: hypothetical protein IPM98_19190 [Lewinellaceae bacterium]|nr:hypothetical protein [Lewinellaceae bacterium]